MGLDFRGCAAELGRVADRPAGKGIVIGAAAVQNVQDLVDLRAAEQPVDAEIARDARGRETASGVVETTSM